MTAAPDHARPLGTPTPTRDRILALDVVRGFAAFGILMVNVQTFGGPYPLMSGEPWGDLASQATYAVVDVFFVSKFFPLFSLLFGLGLSMQMRAAESRGADVGRFVRRRLAGLFAIGLVHVAFLSTIDILVQYAVLGLALIPLRRASPRALLGLALACLTVPVVLTVGAVLTHALEGAWGDATAASMIEAYGRGDLADFFAMRAQEIRGYYLWVGIYAGWEMLAMILVGAYVERVDLVRDLAFRRAELARIARLALAVGVPAAVAHATLWMITRRMESTPGYAHVASSLASAVGEPATAIGYASGLAWLAGDPAWARRLAPLADVGRLALSSYLLQSIGMSLVFFSFGLGRYGQDPPLVWVAFVVAFFGVEVALARVYLRRFRVGPLEALWRAATYGRLR